MKPWRKRLLHLTLVAIGALVVALLVMRAGPASMAAAVARIGVWIPALLLFEVAIVVLNAAGLASLYRAGGSPPLGSALWRASFQAQLFAVAAPAGRVVAETFRAQQLSAQAGRARAAAAAAWMMAIVLLANALIAIPTALAVAAIDGATWPAFAVAAFAVVTFAIGGALVVAGRARLGRWLGRRLSIARDAGPAFDTAFLAEGSGVRRALLFELGARCVLVCEVLLLRHAVGAPADLMHGLATTGVVLAGAAAGDFIPGQLGATDAPVSLASRGLGLRGAGAIALTLSLHAVQLCVGLAGAIVVPLLLPSRASVQVESSS